MPIMQPSSILACFAHLALWYYLWWNADWTNANYATIMDIGMFCIFGIVVLPAGKRRLNQCQICNLRNPAGNTRLHIWHCWTNAIYATWYYLQGCAHCIFGIGSICVSPQVIPQCQICKTCQYPWWLHNWHCGITCGVAQIETMPIMQPSSIFAYFAYLALVESALPHR